MNKVKHFSPVAYALVVAFSFVLLTAWFVGPTPDMWVAAQNRAPYQLPAINSETLAKTETYKAIDNVIGDSIRVKLPVVRTVEKAFLSLTGLTLSTTATTGTLIPSFLPADPLHLPLFLNDDFLQPCGRDMSQIRSGLLAFQKAMSESGRTGLAIVAPNKTTVLFDKTNSWQNALMSCSTAGYSELQAIQQTSSILAVITPGEVTRNMPIEPYWSGDTHWKPQAAKSLLPYVKTLAGTSTDFIGRTDTFHTFVKEQDLLAMLSITQTQETQEPDVNGAPITHKDTTLNNGLVVAGFNNPNADDSMKTVIVVVDSFVMTTDLQAKIERNFSSGYFMDWSSLNSIKDLPKTDVVLLESVERYSYSRLAHLPQVNF